MTIETKENELLLDFSVQEFGEVFGNLDSGEIFPYLLYEAAGYAADWVLCKKNVTDGSRMTGFDLSAPKTSGNGKRITLSMNKIRTADGREPFNGLDKAIYIFPLKKKKYRSCAGILGKDGRVICGKSEPLPYTGYERAPGSNPAL